MTRRERIAVAGSVVGVRGTGVSLACATTGVEVGGERLVAVQVETEIVAGAEALAAELDRVLGGSRG